MKSDIDRLLVERGFAAILVTGSASNNPPMYYLCNGAAVGETTSLVKKPGEPPVLIVNPFERDEAAKSGLRVIEASRYNPLGILAEERGDRLAAMVRGLEAICADLGVSGKVAIYGREDQGRGIALANALKARNSAIELAGEFSDTVFDRAWATKDAGEVARIRDVGRRTIGVVAKTAGFLQSHAVRDGLLLRADGNPLTVGDVKASIRMWLAEAKLETLDGMIFAIGRDAGVPHSEGEDADVIALGKTIVFDIFPCEAGGGYFYDFTRTWCLGFAPPEVIRAHQQVMEAYGKAVSTLRVNRSVREPQQVAQAVFEGQGHATLRTNSQTNKGYVHSLGHGIGLSVHESPSLSNIEGNKDILLPGSVFTVEPGLYYPDDGGFGIRIEDCYWMNPDTGQAELLVEYPRDLVLPVGG